MGLVAGTLQPQSGYIVLDGKILFDSQKGVFVPREQRSVGAVLQYDNINSIKTALDNLSDTLNRTLKQRQIFNVDYLVELLELGPWSLHLTGSLRSATQEPTTIRAVNSGRIVGARLTKDCCNMSKMSDMSLLIEEPRLFDNLCSTLYLGVGFKLVKKNKGAAGIDGVSIEDFEANLDEELSQLQQELCNWTYQPSPVRRVEIPKPDGKGVRLLGIPTVRDRVVQTTLKLLLEPIFEPCFSPHSYGFHPSRSAHQAVAAAQQIINNGKPYVVDIDLEKFFDRINLKTAVEQKHKICKDYIL